MTTYDYFDYLLVGAGPAAAAAANEKYMITPTAGVILKNKNTLSPWSWLLTFSCLPQLSAIAICSARSDDESTEAA